MKVQPSSSAQKISLNRSCFTPVLTNFSRFHLKVKLHPKMKSSKQINKVLHIRNIPALVQPLERYEIHPNYLINQTLLHIDMQRWVRFHSPLQQAHLATFMVHCEHHCNSGSCTCIRCTLNRVQITSSSLHTTLLKGKQAVPTGNISNSSLNHH